MSLNLVLHWGTQEQFTWHSFKVSVVHMTLLSTCLYSMAALCFLTAQQSQLATAMSDSGVCVMVNSMT